MSLYGSVGQNKNYTPTIVDGYQLNPSKVLVLKYFVNRVTDGVSPSIIYNERNKILEYSPLVFFR